MFSPRLIKPGTLPVLPVGGDAEVEVGDLPVKKVKGVCSGPAVELSFDSLGMCVRSELLRRLLHNQKQGVLLRLVDL